jgi:opacity protein-like surface antigen
MLKTAGTALAVLCLMAAAAAQDYRFDAGAAATYSFFKDASGNGRTLSQTQSFGGLASFRMKLAAKHALEVELGRTTNDQVYAVSAITYRVQSTVSDFTGSYVFSPMKFGKVAPFVLAGAGVVVFNPASTFVNSNLSGIGVTRQTRPGFLFGAGFDYPVYWRLAVRVQYRGLFYRAPDFSVPALFTGANGYTSVPSVGVVFRF